MTDPFMTPDDVRAIFPGKLDNESDEMLAAFIAAFEGVVLKYRGFPLVPTTATVQARVARDGSVLLPLPLVQSVDSVSWLPCTYSAGETSTVLDEDALAALPAPDRVGFLFGIGAPFDARVTLGVTWVIDPVPGDATYVCAEYVRKRAKETSGNKPRQAIPTEDGQNFAYNVDRPDPKNDKWTGIPVVDTAIANWPDYREPALA